VSQARIFRAPGRVNLIGEHTDYNLGFVLPIALELAISIRTIPLADQRLEVYSAAHGEGRSWQVGDIGTLRPAKHWSDYVVGTAQQLIGHGFDIPPLSLHIESTLPEGAGLSSSAALEVASALALLKGRPLDRLEIARCCQRAESEFVGMPCGIMDQFVSLFARENSATKIDCRSLTSEAVRLPDNVAILAVNSMVKHSLGQSAYRTRVAECAEASGAMGVESLRDATLPRVLAAALTENVRRRSRHIVTENRRVEDFVEAARAANNVRMGQLFLESHASMRDDYEISCEEIDFLVASAAQIPGCFGARMTGGGFGGCTVNLVAAESVRAFVDAIRKAYRARYAVDPQVIRCVPSGGAAEIV
jgi:galactokinase